MRGGAVRQYRIAIASVRTFEQQLAQAQVCIVQMSK